jgi:hypothetical protein
VCSLLKINVHPERSVVAITIMFQISRLQKNSKLKTVDESQIPLPSFFKQKLEGKVIYDYSLASCFSSHAKEKICVCMHE